MQLLTCPGLIKAYPADSYLSPMISGFNSTHPVLWLLGSGPPMLIGRHQSTCMSHNSKVPPLTQPGIGALSPLSLTIVINLRSLLSALSVSHSSGSKSDLMESDRSSTQTPWRSVLGSWVPVECQSTIGRFPDMFQGMGTSS
jgi:hypothetical protein